MFDKNIFSKAKVDLETKRFKFFNPCKVGFSTTCIVWAQKAIVVDKIAVVVIALAGKYVRYTFEKKCFILDIKNIENKI